MARCCGILVKRCNIPHKEPATANASAIIVFSHGLNLILDFLYVISGTDLDTYQKWKFRIINFNLL